MTTQAPLEDPRGLRPERAEAFFARDDALELIRGVRVEGGVHDPYPVYREYRTRGGLVPGDLMADAFGAAASGSRLHRDSVLFSAVRHEDVAHVLSHPDVFSSTYLEPVFGLGRNMVVVDPPEHHRLRSPVQPNFHRGLVQRWREEIIDPLVAEGVQRLAGSGQRRGELMSAFIDDLPVQVISRLLGLDDADLSLLQRLAAGMLLLTEENPEISSWAFARIGRLFEETVAERADRGVPNVISTLVSPGGGGGDDALSTGEVVTFLRLLLPAGSETTFKGIGSMLVGLLTHPDQFAAVRTDPSLVPDAVHEALRWEAPTNGTGRIALRDTEVGGVPIPAGAIVNTFIQSACHDETVIPGDPESFDIARRKVPNLAFGYGPHRCLGVHLAKAEMESVLAGLVLELPTLRIDTDAPPPKIVGTGLRGPLAVHVAW